MLQMTSPRPPLIGRWTGTIYIALVLFACAVVADPLNASAYNITTPNGPTTPAPTRANAAAPLPASVCSNVTRRNVTGLLAPTSWLNAWLAGPPAIDLRFPWGTSGTWNVASTKTIDDLLQESARGGNFSILVPVWVSTSYSNRTVVLYVYDITHQIGLGLVDLFLNRTADYAPTASTVIVRVTAATFNSPLNITTRRYDLGCTTDGPVPSNISSAKWLALAAVAAYNVSDVDPWTGNEITPNVTVAQASTAAPSVTTMENLYLLIGLACLLLISLVLGLIYVVKSVTRNDVTQKELEIARKSPTTSSGTPVGGSQSNANNLRSVAAVSFGFDNLHEWSHDGSKPSSTANSNTELNAAPAPLRPVNSVDI